jgi:hypothetical protein
VYTAILKMFLKKERPDEYECSGNVPKKPRQAITRPM